MQEFIRPYLQGLLYGKHFAELSRSKIKQKNKLIKHPVTERMITDVSHPQIILRRQTEGFPMFSGMPRDDCVPRNHPNKDTLEFANRNSPAERLRLGKLG